MDCCLEQVARLTAEATLTKIQTELARLRDYEQVDFSDSLTARLPSRIVARIECVGTWEQARRDHEDEYRHRIETELERISGSSRQIDQLRTLIKDVDSKISRSNAEYFSAPPYQTDDNGDDDEENFFLG